MFDRLGYTVLASMRDPCPKFMKQGGYLIGMLVTKV